jgi:hypothetical protein
MVILDFVRKMKKKIQDNIQGMFQTITENSIALVQKIAKTKTLLEKMDDHMVTFIVCNHLMLLMIYNLLIHVLLMLILVFLQVYTTLLFYFC